MSAIAQSLRCASVVVPLTVVDPVVLREIPWILQIFRDEVWLESERRGYRVLADDPVVRNAVCLIIIRIGAQMREVITAELAATASPR